MYCWIYWIIITGLICLTVYFWNKAKTQKRKKEFYILEHKGAKEKWAAQSNAVREKGIECDKWRREFENLEKKLKKARITI